MSGKILVVGFETQRVSRPFAPCNCIEAKPTRKAVSGPRQKPISVEDTARLQQAEGGCYGKYENPAC